MRASVWIASLALIAGAATACGGVVDMPPIDDDPTYVASPPAPSGTIASANLPYNDMTKSQHWSTVDTASVNIGSGYAGSAFDGRFLYLAPGGSGKVARYDTRGAFGAAASWSTFDVTSVDATAAGFRGAAFDGRYVYLVPYSHSDAALGGTVTRFDTRAAFDDVASWSTFDVSTLDVRAAGFVGAAFDGRYLFLVPYGQDTALTGVVARFDTQSSFTARASWSTFDVTTLDTNARGYYGATFDGRYLYLSSYADGWGSYSGYITRYDTEASFTDGASWSIFDTRSVDPRAKGFFGATFDGRYAYFVPYAGDGSTDDLVARYDTRSDFARASSWSVFDASVLGGGHGVGPQGAVFDGRYVYLAPSATKSGPSGLVARFDTERDFTSSSSWTTFDTTSVNANASWFWGGAFDGEYVYFVPSLGTAVARFDARTPPAMPAAYHGSFF